MENYKRGNMILACAISAISGCMLGALLVAVAALTISTGGCNG